MLKQGLKNPIGFSAAGWASDQPGLLHRSVLEDSSTHADIASRNGNHSHYGPIKCHLRLYKVLKSTRLMQHDAYG